MNKKQRMYDELKKKAQEKLSERHQRIVSEAFQQMHILLRKNNVQDGCLYPILKPEEQEALLTVLSELNEYMDREKSVLEYDKEKHFNPEVLYDVIREAYNDGWEDGARLSDKEEGCLSTSEYLCKQFIKLLPHPRYTQGETDKFTEDYVEGFNKCLIQIEKLCY